jgi:hypothetical protein
MIQRKLKPCAYHKGKSCYIFSKGMCKEGWQKTYGKPLNPYKPIKIDKRTQERFSEKRAFLKVWVYWKGKDFLTGKVHKLEFIKAGNFAHLLSKGKHEYFRYYPKNIVIIDLMAHFVIDHGSLRQLIKDRIWSGKETKQAWKKLFKLREELLREYEEWIKEHRGEYKV